MTMSVDLSNSVLRDEDASWTHPEATRSPDGPTSSQCGDADAPPLGRQESTGQSATQPAASSDRARKLSFIAMLSGALIGALSEALGDMAEELRTYGGSDFDRSLEALEANAIRRIENACFGGVTTQQKTRLIGQTTKIVSAVYKDIRDTVRLDGPVSRRAEESGFSKDAVQRLRKLATANSPRPFDRGQMTLAKRVPGRPQFEGGTAPVL